MNSTAGADSALDRQGHDLLTYKELGGLLLFLFGTHLTTSYSYLLFHSMAELFSVFVAVTIFLVVINSWRIITNQYFLFVGAALGFIALLDSLHTLAYKGMGVFTDYDYYAPQLWIAARYLESLSMVIAFLFLERDRLPKLTQVLAGLAAITLGLISSIFYFKNFPTCFEAGKGLTTFKVVSEYAICSLFALSLMLLNVNRQYFEIRIFRFLQSSIVAMISSELCFTLYVSDAMSDYINEAGHLFKIVAFYFVYKAVIVTGFRDPIRLLSRQLAESTKELEAKRLLDVIVENIPSTVFLKRASDMRFEMINRAGESLIGLTRAEIVGHNDYDLLPKEQADIITRKDAFVLNQHDVVEIIEDDLPAPRGNRSVHMKKVSLFDQNGRPQYLLGIIEDITEHRRVQKKLAERKALLRNVIETTKDGFFITDVTGCILEVNDVYCRQSGYSAQELLSKRVSDMEAAESPEKNAAHIKKILHEGGDLFETLHRKKDGSIWSLEVSVTFMPELGGRLIFFCRDITERREVERNLRESENRFRTFVYFTPLAMAMFDQKMNYLAASQRWLSDYGLNGQDLTGLCHYDVFPEITQAWKDIHRRGLNGEYIENTADPYRRANGRVQWLHWQVVPWSGADGAVQGIIISSQDITAEQKAAEELKRHRDHLEQLVAERTAQLENSHQMVRDTHYAMDHAGFGSIWVTPSNNRIIHTNRYAANLLGYSEAEMLSLTIPDLDPNFDQQASKEVSDAVQANKYQRFESSMRHKQGHCIPVEVTLYFLEGDANREARVISFITDITERKMIERELQAAKAVAEEASRAKGEFLANMSHEIRTPLNGVLGMAQIGYRDNAGRGKSQETFARILDSGRLLLTIINDILDYSKIEAGKLEIESIAFDPTALADNVRETLASAAAAKGLQMVSEIAPDLPAASLGDPVRISQILLNLVSNAIKFTAQGEVRLSARREAQALVFQVHDTGIGIAPAVFGRLFNPFEQADNSTTRKFGGTGLGLAISRRLADRMGGSLTVASTEGQGSTFTLRLPLRETEQRAITDQRAISDNVLAGTESAYLAGRRLLLAEDDNINREVAQELLRGSGLTVDSAADGREAVEMAQKNQYDLILMDMQMPNMDGLEATAAIRALPGYANLPIVAMTANAFREDRERCLAAGMNDFISKPVDADILSRTLARWLPVSEVVLPTRNVDGVEIPSELLAISGLDVPSGLKRLRGRLATYLRCLRLYAADHHDDMSLLREHLSHGDPTGAKRIAHTLKGTSSTLAATRVQTMASELESAIQEGQNPDAIEKAITALEKELEHLAAAILKALPPLTSPPEKSEKV